MQSEKNVPKCSCQLLLHNSPRFNGKHAAHPLPATNYHRESCLGSDCSSVLSALNPSRPSCSECSTAPPAPPPKSQPPTGYGIKATKWKTSTAPYYLDAATPRNHRKPAKAQGLLPLNAEAGTAPSTRPQLSPPRSTPDGHHVKRDLPKTRTRMLSIIGSVPTLPELTPYSCEFLDVQQQEQPFLPPAIPSSSSRRGRGH